jgi:hypothetical protein
VPFEARGIDSDEPSRFSYGSKTATDCVLPTNPSFFELNPFINTLRGFWDKCGKFTPPEHSSVSFFRGKHQITAWHKTCVQLWQYAMAMDVAAAELRPPN